MGDSAKSLIVPGPRNSMEKTLPRLFRFHFEPLTLSAELLEGAVGRPDKSCIPSSI